MSDFLALRGPNFSGRSRWLAERRAGRPWPQSHLIGPYPESALSGLAWRVREELSLAALASAVPRPRAIADELGLDALTDRELHVLSGGELVRTALACALLGDVQELQVDVALEQLDVTWRKAVMAVLKARAADRTIAVADNRLDEAEVRQFDHIVDFPAPSAAVAMKPDRGAQWLATTRGSRIGVEDLCFAYGRGAPDVLGGISLALEPGTLSFLRGPNGAGKTTFVRLLSGTLLPRQGRILSDGESFRPARSSRRHAAIAFQNPDFQWTALTVADEIGRSGIDRSATLSAVCEAFGIPPSVVDQNPVDLPFAIKKRLGGATCFLSRMPWLIFDEPTLAQDTAYCEAFGRYVAAAIGRGRGVIIISHDPRLDALFPNARHLLVQDRTISVAEVPVSEARLLGCDH